MIRPLPVRKPKRHISPERTHLVAAPKRRPGQSAFDNTDVALGTRWHGVSDAIAAAGPSGSRPRTAAEDLSQVTQTLSVSTFSGHAIPAVVDAGMGQVSR